LTGLDKANPIAQILSAALLLRYSFGLEKEAVAIESAVAGVLQSGLRTIDIANPTERVAGCKETGDKICEMITKA